MARYRVFLDSFSSADEKGGRGRYINRTYAQVRDAVVRAGRFSCFEACERPGMYSQIEHDPELVVTRLGCYPWIGVRLKASTEQGGKGPRRVCTGATGA